jgi:hypothetical protein
VCPSLLVTRWCRWPFETAVRRVASLTSAPITLSGTSMLLAWRVRRLRGAYSLPGVCLSWAGVKEKTWGGWASEGGGKALLLGLRTRAVMLQAARESRARSLTSSCAWGREREPGRRAAGPKR